MQTACKPIAALVALMLVSGSHPAHAQQDNSLRVREAPVGKVDPAAVEDSLVISPDARHLAYVVKHHNGMAVVLDGHESQLYDEVPGNKRTHRGREPELKFSDDGAHFAYAARNRQKSFLVVDGVKSSKEYDSIRPGDFFFSPDGKRMAFIAYQAKKEIVVVDGVESKPYDYIVTWPLEFTPDSQHISFTVQLRNQRRVLVLDGKEIATGIGGFGSVLFSPDGKHWAYDFFEWGPPETRTVVIDGKPGKTYKEAGRIIFSPDSRHSLYSAEDDNGVRMVLDGVEQKPYHAVIDEFDYDFDRNNQPVYRVEFPCAGFSCDSMILVTGKRESKRYDQIVTPPDRSTHGEHITFVASHNGKEMFVHDGEEGEAFDKIDFPAVSSDGQRLLYSGVREHKRYLVTNGNSVLLPHGITQWCMALDPEADHYAYCFPRDGKWFVVVDGKETASYDSAPQMWFSPVGQLTYVATNSSKQFIVFDGAKGADYDRIGDISSWDTERPLIYEGWRGNKVVLVFRGKESPAYDWIFTYAPGKQEEVLHFICRRGDQYLAVSVNSAD